MPSPETIKKRKELAEDEIRKNWRSGMDAGDIEEMLKAHAISLGIEDLYDCLLGNPIHMVNLVLRAGEPLTAASLRENEMLHGSATHEDLGDEPAPTASSVHSALHSRSPSFDEDAGEVYTVSFQHPRHGVFLPFRARSCKERESFISRAAVDQLELGELVRDDHGRPTIRINCFRAGSEKSFAILFFVIDSAALTTNAAMGKDAWIEADTPLHSDSGLGSERDESIGRGADEEPLGALQYTQSHTRTHLPPGMTRESLMAAGIFSGAFFASLTQTNYESLAEGSQQRSRSRTRRMPNG